MLQIVAQTKNDFEQATFTTTNRPRVRALTPALKAVLRAGIDLDALEAVSSMRTQQLARLARPYLTLSMLGRLKSDAKEQSYPMNTMA